MSVEDKKKSFSTMSDLFYIFYFEEGSNKSEILQIRSLTTWTFEILKLFPITNKKTLNPNTDRGGNLWSKLTLFFLSENQ